MRKTGFVLFSALFCAGLAPGDASAQSNFGAEMSGVNEVLVEYVHFDDPKMSELCGLTRDEVAAVLKAAFAGTSVPRFPLPRPGCRFPALRGLSLKRLYRAIWMKRWGACLGFLCRRKAALSSRFRLSPCRAMKQSFIGAPS